MTETAARRRTTNRSGVTAGVLITLAAVLLAHAAYAQSKSDDETPPRQFAFGFGSFSPQFSGKDTLLPPQHRPLTVTGGSNPDSDSISLTNSAAQAFVEWYFIPQLAVGWTWSTVRGDRRTSFSSATLFNQNFYNPAEYIERVTVESNFLTLTWLPFRWEYLRLGLVGGVGNLSYRYLQQVSTPNFVNCFFSFSSAFGGSCDDVAEIKYQNRETVSSIAYLAGIFADLGWRHFGIRGGIRYLDAQLPQLTAIQPDVPSRTFTVAGSHAESYVALRFGF